MSARRTAVLVTGCSTGIGRATAGRFLAAGWPVWATARRLDAVQDLATDGAVTSCLDVTDEESMRAVVADIEAEYGAVGVLVNNAGYGLHGPVEELSPADLRTQFDTNVFGLVRLTQLVLPGMRRAGYGRIVNVSSMGGRLTFPGGGAYHASKYAVEAVSDALRFEVAGFGVRVVVVEPGPVRTPWIDTAVATIDPTYRDGPYAGFSRQLAATLAGSYTGSSGRLASSPDRVAAVIVRAAGARHPRARYVVGPVGRALVLARRVLPDAAWDLLLARQFPRPAGR